MAKKKRLRLEQTLKYLSWDHIAGAVLDVFAENRAQEKLSHFSADSESWARYSEQRQDVWRRTRAAWCTRTGKDFTWFPYSEDYVARLYDRFCKLEPFELKAYQEETATIDGDDD